MRVVDFTQNRDPACVTIVLLQIRFSVAGRSVEIVS